VIYPQNAGRRTVDKQLYSLSDCTLGKTVHVSKTCQAQASSSSTSTGTINLLLSAVKKDDIKAVKIFLEMTLHRPKDY
jgi:hypothetical protein